MTSVPCIQNESELVFDGGILSTFGTLIACLGHVEGPKLIPVIYDGALLRPLQLKTGIELNNIGTIDPVGAVVTLDLYLDFYWRDHRFHMPLFWDRAGETLRREGVRLERIFRDSSGRCALTVAHGLDRLPDFMTCFRSFIWLPDIFFLDGINVVELNYVRR